MDVRQVKYNIGRQVSFDGRIYTMTACIMRQGDNGFHFQAELKELPCHCRFEESRGIHKMTIGERIREIRRDQNISQTQLAQAAGLNQPQVSAIEGGRVKPSAKTIERIATALHVPVESITNEQPKPDPTFTPYQVMLIYKAIQHRIDEEINRLADGMQVDKSEVLRVWEEHKDD